jgi:hypothetical protein
MAYRDLSKLFIPHRNKAKNPRNLSTNHNHAVLARSYNRLDTLRRVEAGPIPGPLCPWVFADVFSVLDFRRCLFAFGFRRRLFP